MSPASLLTLQILSAPSLQQQDPALRETVPSEAGGAHDVLTLAAAGPIAFLTTSLAHEAAGHGLFCAAQGGSFQGLHLTQMDCDPTGLTDGQIDAAVWAGPGANLLLGTTLTTSMWLNPPESPALAHLIWFTGSINLLVGSSNVWTNMLTYDPEKEPSGDIGIFVSHRDNPDPWRIGLLAGGVAVSLGTGLWIAPRLAEPLLGETERKKRAMAVAWIPFATGVAAITAGSLIDGPEAAGHAAIAYGLGSMYIGYVPLMAPKDPREDRTVKELVVKRGVPTLVAAGASLVAMGVLGAGVGTL